MPSRVRRACHRLEQWRERALAGIDATLKEHENDPLEKRLNDNLRIGELVMEVETLQKEQRARRPLVGRRPLRKAARAQRPRASFGLQRVCRVLESPRSTVYAQEKRESAKGVPLRAAAGPEAEGFGR